MSRTHYKTLVDSEYLGQWDLIDKQGKALRPTVEIESVTKFVPAVLRKKRMPDGSYKPEAAKRLVIRFRGKRKAWLSGPATQDIIRRMYGPYIEDWIGKKVTLFVDPNVMMGRDKVGGIRVHVVEPNESPTDEPLDNPVDEDARALQDAAREHESEEATHEQARPLF